jgi:hypothetical protein
MSKTFYKNVLQKVDKKCNGSFSSTFVVFLSEGSSKTLQRTFCKKMVSKNITKKSTKNPKPNFSGFVISRFPTFLGEGSSKAPKKKYGGGGNLTSCPFFGL